MTEVFEEPAKTEMRGACEVAIDQAGYELVATPVRLALPSDSGLRGALIGDLQSTDATGERTFYYLRPGTSDALPKWLANIARASHGMRVGQVYVVVNEYTAAFAQSCKTAGAGLLRLNEDSVFEVVHDYYSLSPMDPAVDFSAKTALMRREMERKLELRRKEIEARYERVTHLVSDMDSAAADEYIGLVEREYKALDDWGFDLSRRLDELTTDSSPSVIASLQEAIDGGPVDDGGEAAA
jgi:hypothetical protein